MKRLFKRRDFLCAILEIPIAVFIISSLSRNRLPGVLPAMADMFIKRDAGKKSVVVSVFHPGAVGNTSGMDNENLDGDVIAKMLNEGIMAYTGKDFLEDAWKAVIPDPSKKVAIKINCQIRGICTKFKVVKPIVDGLVSRGVNPDNIFIYDKTDTAFDIAGFIKNTGKGVKIGVVNDFGGYARFLFDSMANLLTGGFSNAALNYLESIRQTSGSSIVKNATQMVLNLFTKEFDCEYLINVPVLKALDGYSGVSLSMKNHYGSIANPHDHHSDIMDYIPYLNSLPQIREKTRLIIMDAIFVEYKWQNGRKQDYVERMGRILISDDPVAMDSIGWKMIEEKRKEHGLPPVSPQPVFIQKAADSGLGVNDPEHIVFKEINLN